MDAMICIPDIRPCACVCARAMCVYMKWMTGSWLKEGIPKDLPYVLWAPVLSTSTSNEIKWNGFETYTKISPIVMASRWMDKLDEWSGFSSIFSLTLSLRYRLYALPYLTCAYILYHTMPLPLFFHSTVNLMRNLKLAHIHTHTLTQAQRHRRTVAC